jgi:predicted small secreted protein
MDPKYFVSVAVVVCAVAFSGCSDTNTGGGSDTRPTAAAIPARATGPLPDGGFRANITVVNAPTELTTGAPVTLSVKVKNTGTVAWPMAGRPGDGFFQVNLGDHWKDKDGKDVKIDERVAMPHDVAPGAEVERALVVKAPDKEGDYVLELDMVQEGVAWFSQKGSEPLKLNIKVTR